MGRLLFIIVLVLIPQSGYSAENMVSALRRVQYLLTGTMPTDAEFSLAADTNGYRAAVRSFLLHKSYYTNVLRYHERLFGTGLPTDYIDELMRDDIDNKKNKFAQILCSKGTGSVLRCQWSSAKERTKQSSCPPSWERPAAIFWYPGLTAWVCPSIARSCGPDLSRCFIEFDDEDVAAKSELGTTEAFDSRFAVIKSLSKQSAGVATAVVLGNYPYTKILEPGLFAVDGAIAHFYRQAHHFDLKKLGLSAELLEIVNNIELTDTRFRLVYTGTAYEQAGVLSTFGWLRRYEKNRSRGNQLYQRLLCRQFTAELPRIFPQDPGNLRETPGCMGCHATLDPLADFFKAWGEGGELYTGNKEAVATTFAGHSGSTIADLANIIRNDDAFATCTVHNVWKWLMGRDFDSTEAKLRLVLTTYFLTTNYNFSELVYAVTTHPAFLEGERGNAQVDDPLSEPPLGQPPGGNNLAACPDAVSFATDVQPKISLCTRCHTTPAVGGANVDLATEAQWKLWAGQAISFMASGQMPPSGGAGPPRVGPVFDLKEAVRCWVEKGEAP